MIFKSVLGIYIGKSSFSAVWLKGGYSGARMGFHLTADFDKEEDIKSKCDKVTGLLKEALAEHSLTPSDVRLGIAKDWIILRALQFPTAVKENLKSTIKYEMERYIPLNPDDIVYDYNLIHTDKKRKLLHVLLFAAKKEVVEPFARMARDLFNGAECLEPGTAGIASLLLANSRYAKNSFMFANIEDEGIECGVILEKRFIASHYTRLVDRDPDTLVSTLTDSIEHLKSIAPVPEGLPLIRSGFETSGEIDNLLSTRLSCSLINLDFRDIGIHSHAQAKAHGIALAGLGNRGPWTNLMPVEQRKKSGRIAYYVMMVLMLVVVLSLAGLGGGMVIKKYRYNNLLDDRLAAIMPEVKTINELMRKTEINTKRISHINGLRTGSPRVSDVVLELSMVLPESTWIEKFSLSKDEFRVEGYTDSASDILSLLESSPKFKDVVFLSAITRRQGKEFFRIGFKVEKEKK